MRLSLCSALCDVSHLAFLKPTRLERLSLRGALAFGYVWPSSHARGETRVLARVLCRLTLQRRDGLCTRALQLRDLRIYLRHFELSFSSQKRLLGLFFF